MAEDEGPCIEPGVPHLGCDREESRDSAIGHEECRDGIHSPSEGWSVNELIIRDPVTILRCRIGAVLDADADGHGKDWAQRYRKLLREEEILVRLLTLTCCQKKDQSNPCKPGEATKGTDTGNRKAQKGGHANKSGRTRAVRRNGVEADRDT